MNGIIKMTIAGFSLFLVASLGCSPQVSQVQTGNGVSKLTQRLADEYNNKNSSSIFNQFDKNMKEALPEEQATPFFANLFSKYGLIKK